MYLASKWSFKNQVEKCLTFFLYEHFEKSFSNHYIKIDISTFSNSDFLDYKVSILHKELAKSEIEPDYYRGTVAIKEAVKLYLFGDTGEIQLA